MFYSRSGHRAMEFDILQYADLWVMYLIFSYDHINSPRRQFQRPNKTSKKLLPEIFTPVVSSSAETRSPQTRKLRLALFDCCCFHLMDIEHIQISWVH